MRNNGNIYTTTHNYGKLRVAFTFMLPVDTCRAILW